MDGNEKLQAMGIANPDDLMKSVAKTVQTLIYYRLVHFIPFDLAQKAATDGANEAARIVRMVLEEA